MSCGECGAKRKRHFAGCARSAPGVEPRPPPRPLSGPCQRCGLPVGGATRGYAQVPRAERVTRAAATRAEREPMPVCAGGCDAERLAAAAKRRAFFDQAALDDEARFIAERRRIERMCKAARQEREAEARAWDHVWPTCQPDGEPFRSLESLRASPHEWDRALVIAEHALVALKTPRRAVAQIIRTVGVGHEDAERIIGVVRATWRDAEAGEMSPEALDEHCARMMQIFRAALERGEMRPALQAAVRVGQLAGFWRPEQGERLAARSDTGADFVRSVAEQLAGAGGADAVLAPTRH